MKVGIIGTRGIPNNYGGFEQCAEYLAKGFTRNGIDVSVYCPHNHPYKFDIWENVKLIHCFDPSLHLGSTGQFIYDLNCVINSRKQNFDIILQLGYTSNSIWAIFLPKKKSSIITNMDGLEWMRKKYSFISRKYLKFAERLAVHTSDFLISDSIGIQKYILSKYNMHSFYIPYGANVFHKPDISILNRYKLEKYGYNLIIARFEPENNFEIILNGVKDIPIQFLIIGNYGNKFGTYLKIKFKKFTNIIFSGSIFDIEILNNLRFYSNLYFHGHSVGGTNPSLLEAMASNALICANDNIFNRSILQEDAYYFKSADDIKKIAINIKKDSPSNKMKINNNLSKIINTYSWETIISQYIHKFQLISSQ